MAKIYMNLFIFKKKKNINEKEKKKKNREKFLTKILCKIFHYCLAENS